MTRTADPDEIVDPAPANRPRSSHVATFAFLVFVALAAAIGLSQWRNPFSMAILAVSATIAPVVGFSLFSRRFIPGPGFRAIAVGFCLALASWSVLSFLSILAFHSTASWLQAIILIIVNTPGLWLMTGSRKNGTPLHTFRAAAVQALPALALIAVTATVGALVIELAQTMARNNLKPTTAFAVFWLGMLILYGTLSAVVLKSRGMSVTTALIAIGGISYIPTFVRSPLRVFNYDEFAHVAEARQIVFSGHLYQADSVVPIGPKYPGFETLVVSIARLTGLPIVATGQVCILLCHIATIVGVGSIAIALRGFTERTALIAGLMYAVAPQFVYFDALFSYETLALPYFVTIVSLILLRDQADAESKPLPVYVCLTSLLAALMITHHLTSVSLSMFLALAAFAFLVSASIAKPERRRRHLVIARRNAALGIVFGGATIAYSAIVKANIFEYLSAFPNSAYRGLSSFLGFSDSVNVDSVTNYSQRSSATRGLFQGTSLPLYERVVGVGMQFVLLVLCLVVLWQLRRRLAAWVAVFAILSAAYFVSLPLSFVAVASAGAHRAEAVTFVGVAALVALAFQSDVRLSPRTRTSTHGAERTRSPAIVVLVLLTLMASYSTSVNLYSRFPGPFVLGADGRDDTSDVTLSAHWLLRNAGPLQPIIATRRDGAVFAAISGSRVVNFPAWALYYPEQQPPETTVASFRKTGAKYLIADASLSFAVSQQSYFSPSEPAPPSVPLPAQSFLKFASSSWLQKVYSQGRITIYRVVR